MLKEQAEQLFFVESGWGHNIPSEAHVYQYTGTVAEGDSLVNCATVNFHSISDDSWSNLYMLHTDDEAGVAYAFTKNQVESDHFSFLYTIQAA